MEESGPRPETLHFKPNGRVPNSRFPVLLYRGAVAPDASGDLADAIEATFRRHDWLNNWRELGVYDYDHFHSTTHEPAGDSARADPLRLGGEGRDRRPLRPVTSWCGRPGRRRSGWTTRAIRDGQAATPRP